MVLTFDIRYLNDHIMKSTLMNKFNKMPFNDGFLVLTILQLLFFFNRYHVKSYLVFYLKITRRSNKTE